MPSTIYTYFTNDKSLGLLDRRPLLHLYFMNLGLTARRLSLFPSYHLLILQDSAFHVNQQLPRSHKDDCQTTSDGKDEGKIRIVSLWFIIVVLWCSGFFKGASQVMGAAIYLFGGFQFRCTFGGDEELVSSILEVIHRIDTVRL